MFPFFQSQTQCKRSGETVITVGKFPSKKFPALVLLAVEVPALALAQAPSAPGGHAVCTSLSRANRGAVQHLMRVRCRHRETSNCCCCYLHEKGEGEICISG